MKDAYGTELEIGARVVVNYKGFLAKGIVREIVEKLSFGKSKLKRMAVVEIERPKQQDARWKMPLEAIADHTLCQAQQVIVMNPPYISSSVSNELWVRSRAELFTLLYGFFKGQDKLWSLCACLVEMRNRHMISDEEQALMKDIIDARPVGWSKDNTDKEKRLKWIEEQIKNS